MVHPVKTIVKSNSVGVYNYSSEEPRDEYSPEPLEIVSEQPAGSSGKRRKRFRSPDISPEKKDTYQNLKEAQKFFSKQLKERCHIALRPEAISGDNVKGLYQLLYNELKATASSPKKLRWWGEENRRLIQLSRARITIEKELPPVVTVFPSFSGVRGSEVFSSRQQAANWLVDMSGTRGFDVLRYSGYRAEGISELNIIPVIESLYRAYFLKAVEAMGLDRAMACMQGEEGRLLIRNLSAARDFILTGDK